MNELTNLGYGIAAGFFLVGAIVIYLQVIAAKDEWAMMDDVSHLGPVARRFKQGGSVIKFISSQALQSLFGLALVGVSVVVLFV